MEVSREETGNGRGRKERGGKGIDRVK